MLKNFSVLFPCAFGFIGGIWFSSLFPWGYAVAGMALVFALAFLLSGRQLKYLAFFFLLFALGSARMEFRGVPVSDSSSQAGQEVTAEGIIVEEPKPGQTTTQLVVETEDETRLLLTTELYPEYRYGDKIKFSGRLARPENFLTSSGREFDYVKYLARQDIYFQIFKPELTLLARGEGNWFKEKLSWVRDKFISGIESVLPEPQAGLLAGLLIGSRSSLDKNVLEDFRRVGLTHMIVLSGYNLTIVAEAVRAVLGFLPLYSNLGLAGFSIILFALMAGGGAAVWRATFMSLLGLIARATGRVYQVSLALLLTIIVLLIWDPRYLVFDLGFQLSILATLGLIFLSPLVLPYLKRVPARLGLREIVGSTVSAQAAVLPWILYQMGEISIISFVANPLVLVAVPMIMLFGFIAGALSFLSGALAFLPGGVAHLLLSYQLMVVSALAKLPFATVSIPSFPLFLVFLVYSLFIYCYYRQRRAINSRLEVKGDSFPG